MLNRLPQLRSGREGTEVRAVATLYYRKQLFLTRKRMTFKFEFTGEEANLMLQCLAQAPYGSVKDLIAKLMASAQEQQAPAAETI